MEGIGDSLVTNCMVETNDGDWLVRVTWRAWGIG